MSSPFGNVGREFTHWHLIFFLNFVWAVGLVIFLLFVFCLFLNIFKNQIPNLLDLKLPLPTFPNGSLVSLGISPWMAKLGLARMDARLSRPLKPSWSEVRTCRSTTANPVAQSTKRTEAN